MECLHRERHDRIDDVVLVILEGLECLLSRHVRLGHYQLHVLLFDLDGRRAGGDRTKKIGEGLVRDRGGRGRFVAGRLCSEEVSSCDSGGR